MSSPTTTGHVVVFGSINVDVTLSVEHAPVAGETVVAARGRRSLGGKGANQAAAAARAGVDVHMIGVVGDDPDGVTAVRGLRRLGIDVDGVVKGTAPTGLATVIVSSDGENRIVVLPGANGELSAAVFDFPPGADSVLLVQGEVPAEAVRAVLAQSRARGVRTIVNLAPVIDLGGELADADPLVVNEIELRQLTGIDVGDAASVVARAEVLGGLSKTLVVTLGAEGVVVIADGVGAHVSTVAVAHPVDTTGAGDAFVGVLAACLARGSSLLRAAEVATRCASASVEVLGAAESYPDFRERMPVEIL